MAVVSTFVKMGKTLLIAALLLGCLYFIKQDVDAGRQQIAFLWCSALCSVLFAFVWGGGSPLRWGVMQKIFFICLVGIPFGGMEYMETTESLLTGKQFGLAMPEGKFADKITEFFSKRSDGVPLEIWLGALAMCLAGFLLFRRDQEGYK